MSAYHSVLVLAGNDIGPRGTIQLIFTTVMLVAAAIINANIFGNIAVLLQQINRKGMKFQEKIENANSSMKNLLIPEDFQKTIRMYLTTTQSTLDHQQELDSFMSMLSPSLKIQVTRYIFQDIILGNDIFEEKTQVIDLMLADLSILLFYPEDEICKLGDVATQFYFLAKGECDVLVTDQFKVEKLVKTLEVGNYFGEIALLKN